MSFTTATTVPAPDQPASVAGARPHPTRFRVEQPTLTKKPSPQALSVEVEYRRYISSGTSSPDTDVLWFWEVRLFLSNGTIYDSLVE